MSNHQHDTSDLDGLLEDLPSGEAERLREVWQLAADAKPEGEEGSVDTERALSRLLQTLDGVEDDSGSPPPEESVRDGKRVGARDRPPRSGALSERRLGPSAVPWAGAALVLIIAGALFAYWWQQPVARMAPQGEQLAFTLPDGSKVQLNSGSTLRYDRSFGDTRALSLKGEAFFEVAPGDRPFLVRTHNAEVRVLGTAFNVRARPNASSSGTQVTLVEGTVAVRPREGKDEGVQMRPGETRRIQGEGARLSAPLDMTVEEATAWRHGGLVVKDRSLRVLLPEVERRFGVELTVHPDSLKQQRISLALRKPSSAESVVQDVALALGLKYRETADGFTLHK